MALHARGRFYKEWNVPTFKHLSPEVHRISIMEPRQTPKQTGRGGIFGPFSPLPISAATIITRI